MPRANGVQWMHSKKLKRGAEAAAITEMIPGKVRRGRWQNGKMSAAF